MIYTRWRTDTSFCPLIPLFFTKFCKIDRKRITTAVADFYDPEEITATKNRLVSDAAALKLDGMPNIAKRRNSDSRHQCECDDILNVITFLDEHKLLDKLPRYECDSSDYFSSSRMDEADMHMLLRKLNIMQEDIFKDYWEKSSPASVAESSQAEIWSIFRQVASAIKDPPWPSCHSPIYVGLKSRQVSLTVCYHQCYFR